MRMHSRGHANRRWMALFSEQPLEPGAPVTHSRRPDAGKVTSAAVSPDFGPIAAGMLRREVAEDYETVQVQTSSEAIEAEARSMPILRLA